MWDIPTLDENKIPCFQCKNRSITCHATCELYIKWSEDHKKNKKKQRLKNYNDNVGVPKEKAHRRFK